MSTTTRTCRATVVAMAVMALAATWALSALAEPRIDLQLEPLIRPPKAQLLLQGPETVAVGETFDVAVYAEDFLEVAGIEFDVDFGSARFLDFEGIAEGSFFQQDGVDSYWSPGTNGWTISGANRGLNDVLVSRLGEGSVSGSGLIATVTLHAVGPGKTAIGLWGVKAVGPTGSAVRINRNVIFDVLHQVTVTTTVVPEPDEPWDVNKDGIVDMRDLVLVVANLGDIRIFDRLIAVPRANVDGKGPVDIADVVLVAQHFGERTIFAAAAPKLPTAGDVHLLKRLLADARGADDGTQTFRDGIHVLDQLASMAAPRQTALLPNYPNPFNPETWIPFELANDTDVTIRIYNATGDTIRVLDLGWQPAGLYYAASRAAHWDGRDAFGETVSSGVYFYELASESDREVRRMVIRK